MSRYLACIPLACIPLACIPLACIPLACIPEEEWKHPPDALS